jgi:hypothetical protein
VAHDPVRDEAERLVAAALAAFSMAARGLPRSGARPFATGSEECCICPVCRVIASMRDPSADLTDRLASGAGDLAAGVASMLRAFSRPGSDDSASATAEGDDFWESLRQRARAATDPFVNHPFSGEQAGDDSDAGDGDAWRTATSTTPATSTAPPPPMAKKAVKKTVKKAASAPSGSGGASGASASGAGASGGAAASPPRPVAKKAVKKAAPKATSGDE